MQGDRSIASLILFYPVGFVCALACAWAGRWVGFGIGAATVVGATLFAQFFSSIVEVGSHGSGNYMAAWGMAIFAPYMLLGCFVGGALAVFLGMAGAQRRGARELAEFHSEGGGQ